MQDRSWSAREPPTAAIPGCQGDGLRKTRTGWPGSLDDPELDECEAMWKMIAESCHERRGARSAERCLRMFWLCSVSGTSQHASRKSDSQARVMATLAQVL